MYTDEHLTFKDTDNYIDAKSEYNYNTCSFHVHICDNWWENVDEIAWYNMARSEKMDFSVKVNERLLGYVKRLNSELIKSQAKINQLESEKNQINDKDNPFK